jgi:tetratricopeptide (TPR) repeat protein
MAAVSPPNKGKMQQISRRLPAIFAATALTLLSFISVAQDAEPGAASAHQDKAVLAMRRMDFLEASREYRQAAELSDDPKVAREATQLASIYGFNEDALVSAERWRKLDPDNPVAIFNLARIQLRMGNVRDSRRNFRKVIESGDVPADARLLSLVGVLTEEDADSADEIMRWLAKPYKDSADAHYAAAITALQADDVEHAQKRAQRAIELKPDWMKPKLLYGRTLLIAGDPDGAIDYIARLIGDNPQPDPDARMELALIMMAVGREDDALSQVNQIQYETGNRPDALRLMAILNFRQNNLDAASEDFGDLLAMGQFEMDARYYLAQIADFREETDRAIGHYSKVVQGAHVIAAQRRAAALIAFRREAPEFAIERLDKFALENPAYAIDIVQAKAQLLASLERFDESLTYYDRLVEYRPDSEGLSLGRAELLLRMERVDDSVMQYRKAVKRWPESALSLNALGYTLADHTTEYKEAEKLIRKALKYDPESPAIIDSLGWVLHKLGEHEAALVELKRAYEKLDDPEVASHIIEVLASLDRSDEALEMLVAAEEKAPASPLLKDVRERLFAAEAD